MQSLGIISVNLWQILISLCNLLLLTLLLKKFLFKPVKKALHERQSAVQKQYDDAEQAASEAKRLESEWQEKMDGAASRAKSIVKEAKENADTLSDGIVKEAKDKADRLLRQAEADVLLEKKKAEEGLKKEIVDVSTAISEKLLGREIHADDHRALIDDFIGKIGEDDEGDR